MTDVQVYQLAFMRFTEPGKHLANPDQYLDIRLLKAEQQVDYFFSHQVPVTKKGGRKAKKHDHGENHGSLSSKKGNRDYPNQRHGASRRGGRGAKKTIN